MVRQEGNGKVAEKTEAQKASEEQQLKDWVKKLLPEDHDKYDVHAKYDPTLTLKENKTAMREDLKVLITDLKSQAEYTKAQQERIETERINQAEREVAEYNKSITFEQGADMDVFYGRVIRAVNKMCQGYSNLLFVKSRGGVGKCVVLNTKSDFLLSGDGRMLKIKDKPTEVVVMNDKFKLEKAKVKNWYERDVVEVLELITRTNRKILLTPEHPLYTIMGWKEAKDIKVGEFIATPRQYNLGLTKKIDECKVKLIAYLIAEGHLGDRVSFTNGDEDIIQDFKDSIHQFDKRLYLAKDGLSYWVRGNFTRGKHTLHNYLKKIGLFGLNSGEKFIPDEIMQLNNQQIALFLATLYACDGCAEKRHITYSTKSEVLARQLQHLLLRFGVISSIYEKQKCATNTINKIKRTYYDIYVVGRESRLNFIEKIGIAKKDKTEKLRILRENILNSKGNENVDVIPNDVWKITKVKNWVDIGKKLGGYTNPRYAQSFARENNSRYNIQKIGFADNNDVLIKLGNSDIFWDKIKSIRSLTEGYKVYDIEVDHPAHNFVANDIIVHNSYQIRKELVKNKADFVELSGDVTEAYLYRLIFENNGRIIWCKDTVGMLEGLKSINLLKGATETEAEKILTKSNYSKDQADLPDRFLCKCKFIFDYNNVFTAKLGEDFEALRSRGDYIELPFSDDDIKQMMRMIAKEDWQKEVTEEIIREFESNGMVKLNLRTQWKAFRTYEYAQKNNLEWKAELKGELKNMSRIRAMLYTLIGNKAVKTTYLKKMLLKQEIYNTLRTCDNKINEWLYLEEIWKVGEGERDFFVCINDINNKR